MTSENKTRDNGCICRGSWRELVKKMEPFFEKVYRDEHGGRHLFVGLVHGADDYYYGLTGEKGIQLLSCVFPLEQYGYELIDSHD